MPPAIPLQPQLYLKIGGSQVPGDLSDAITSVDVETHLYLPATFAVELRDEGFRWVEHALVAVGQEVEIAGRASEDEQGSESPLLVGEIVAIEATYPESGVPTLVLRGYDLSHRLQRGRKVRSFLQSTDSDIVGRIAQDRGLRPDTDATDHVHTQLYQENLTDYEFLARRARALGFVFYAEGRKLVFKRPGSVAQSPIELNYRQSLLEFRPRLTASAQVTNLNVRGWDPATKQAIVGRARSADYRTARLGWERRGNELARQAFGETETAYSDEPIASQAQGDAYAVAHLSRFWSTDVLAEGEAAGNPRIRAGSVVRIEGVGDRFNGEYFVTSARHVYDANGQYRTAFTIGGYGADTTADLLFPEAARMEQHIGGVSRGLAIGIVTNAKDPENRGRIKVRFPWLADEAESDWARLAMPMSGNGRGFLFIPEVNDEVVVAFEHGDFNRPYVIGSVWNGQDAPPIPASEAVDASGAVVKRVIKTRAGHIIRLDDTPGAEKIEVIDKSGSNKVIIDTAANKITVEAGLEVEIKAGQAINLSAPQVKIDGTQSVQISGAQIESSASARNRVAGGIVEIN